MATRLRKRIQAAIRKQAGEWINEQDAWLGDAAGTVETGTAGILWARLANGNAVRVHNTLGVPSDFDLHIRIGENRHQRKIWQIIRIVDDYDTPAGGGRIGYHHTQHEFMQPDQVILDRRQILQLSVLVSDGAAFIVTVFGAFVHTPGGIAKVDTQALDLSSYAVTAGAKFINIEANDSGALSLHAGSTFGAPAIATVADIPTPDPGKYMIATVLMYEGQTEITNDDIRVPMPLGIIPKSAAAQIDEATADIPASADKFPFYDVSTDLLKTITYADLLDLIPHQYRQFVTVGDGAGGWEFVSSDGTPVFDLQDLE
jgi:hypothetical protein